MACKMPEHTTTVETLLQSRTARKLAGETLRHAPPDDLHRGYNLWPNMGPANSPVERVSPRLVTKKHFHCVVVSDHADIAQVVITGCIVEMESAKHKICPTRARKRDAFTALRRPGGLAWY